MNSPTARPEGPRAPAFIARDEQRQRPAGVPVHDVGDASLRTETPADAEKLQIAARRRHGQLPALRLLPPATQLLRIGEAVRLEDAEALHVIESQLRRERLGSPVHAGDGGFIAAFSDGTVTGDRWRAQSFYVAPLPARDGDRILGYGAVRGTGELARAEGFVAPGDSGRGIGRAIATGLEREAVRRGARRIQSTVFERDTAAHALLATLGYRAVRVQREMRIELGAPPPAPAASR